MQRQKTQQTIKTLHEEGVPLDFRALTKDESIILRKVALSPHAQNAWEVYLGVFTEYLEECSPALYLSGAKPIKEAPNDKRILTELAARLKKQNLNVPNYTRVVRILDDMTFAGWLQKREGGLGRAKAVYYADESLVSRVKQSKAAS